MVNMELKLHVIACLIDEHVVLLARLTDCLLSDWQCHWVWQLIQSGFVYLGVAHLNLIRINKCEALDIITIWLMPHVVKLLNSVRVYLEDLRLVHWHVQQVIVGINLIELCNDLPISAAVHIAWLLISVLWFKIELMSRGQPAQNS